ncbi:MULTISPECIES: copper resistance protein B [Pseudomonas]|uniref:copper resistance protein B n=1 Tax=Pseudomonas TaxID=286 RepID=UPI001BD127C8|nr:MULTISPECIES: copper resistance protein B [Pseudomonas]MBS7600419.1 copper resistance protein B [Pseudomonas sp. RC2C2]MCP6699281.1 copper resistance protein B [Pseudomonas donghuensis]UVL26119.1 copper resistance protein B [Pseudomonas donghuensis]UVL31263.1 copper resistance protein B [Pseudomonas donghuensis]
MNEPILRPLLGGFALLALLASEEARAEAMDHAAMGHGAMNHQGMPAQNMNHQGMNHGMMPQTPRTPLRPITDADRQAAFPPLPGHQVHDRQSNWAVIVEQLEYQNFDSSSALNWNANAWIGGDIDRLWLRTEGERERGVTHKAELQALWGHAISPWWELVGGLRQDFKPASGQTWAAFGIQGTPLYGLELEATLYAGERQQTALRLESSYAILLSNRWILEPSLEANFYGRNDATRDQGSGLADSEIGLRLRYEITRGFAPYLGISFNRAYGNNAEQIRDEHGDIGQTRLVAGVRLRF